MPAATPGPEGPHRSGGAERPLRRKRPRVNFPKVQRVRSASRGFPFLLLSLHF